MPAIAERPTVKIENIAVLCFGASSRLCRQTTLDKAVYDPNKIVVDLDSGMWKFITNKGEETYEIGKGVRVPRGDALWGPAFVFDLTNRDHLAELRDLKRDILRGKLTR